MKLLFISLGCDKNLSDSEEMLGLLREKGYTFTDDEQEAEVIIVNSCCFINDAKEESIRTILEMAQLKEYGNCKALIVTGCLSQRYQEEIYREIPEVDGIVGTSSYDQILEVIDGAMRKERPKMFLDRDRLVQVQSERVITTGGYYAHLKIAEGCDKHCTYCIIPSIRGRYRSVPMERLLEQAKLLAKKGVKELILVAQETTLYGIDLYGEKKLHILLEELCKIPELQMIRLLYCYPEEIYDGLIRTMKFEPKVCHYLDMPIQHCNDRILKRMGRRTNKAQLYEIIEKLRREIPDICLRTTLITGFPGETEEEFQELMEFIDEMEFDRLGAFAYSPEEDTSAAGFPEQVDEDVKAERLGEIMELQQEIAFDKSEDKIGCEMTAIVEGKVVDENAYIARTYMDAPGIDGYVFINSEEALMTGDVVRVRITGAAEYDLIGELISKSRGALPY